MNYVGKEHVGDISPPKQPLRETMRSPKPLANKSEPYLLYYLTYNHSSHHQEYNKHIILSPSNPPLFKYYIYFIWYYLPFWFCFP